MSYDIFSELVLPLQIHQIHFRSPECSAERNIDLFMHINQLRVARKKNLFAAAFVLTEFVGSGMHGWWIHSTMSASEIDIRWIIKLLSRFWFIIIKISAWLCLKCVECFEDLCGGSSTQLRIRHLGLIIWYFGCLAANSSTWPLLAK